MLLVCLEVRDQMGAGNPHSQHSTNTVSSHFGVVIENLGWAIMRNNHKLLNSKPNKKRERERNASERVRAKRVLKLRLCDLLGCWNRGYQKRCNRQANYENASPNNHCLSISLAPFLPAFWVKRGN